MSLLSVEGMSVRFGGVQALTGVDLTVEAGDIHGIIGPNGAGKTTLFNCISGFQRPDGGRVVFAGLDLTGVPPHRRTWLGIARTFQQVGLAMDESVLTNLVMSQHRSYRRPLRSAVPLGRVGRVEVARLARRGQELLDSLDVGWAAERRVDELPHGTRKIVELACALLRDPALLLLDEPSSGLGPGETAALADVVVSVNRCRGVAVVLIEHDVPFVSSIADQLTALSFGTVLATGPPEEVTSDAGVRTAYLGEDPEEETRDAAA